MSIDWSPTTIIETTSEAQTAIAVTTRIANEWAAVALNSAEVLELDPEETEVDDGPDPDDIAEGCFDNEDEPLLDDERDPLVEVTSHHPWITAAISVTADDDFEHAAQVPSAADPAIAKAYEQRRRDWIGTAAVVSNKQAAALRSRTLAEAAVRLEVARGEGGATGGAALERGEGQASRDKRVVVDTPFGPVPFWFFSGPTPNAKWVRSDQEYAALLADLADLGNALMRGEFVVPEHQIGLGARQIEVVFERLGRQPVIKADSIRKSHGVALVTVMRRWDVVARHRGLWPATDEDQLLNDLGLFKTSDGNNPRSHLVALLALAGVFDAALGIWEG